ncbi:MAG: 16S rRNA (uracil(1498)-N(3))-methyltransferase [Azoarcus sp.]|jgi:16S rRNA (uracil1498-N3)-methyltransferase|nr:16S rRNA (uracil(1498)-N(3))-methyltransferase [Azoarcus sp.]
MTTPRFHIPDALPHGGEVELSVAAAHHALKVLRLGAGDAVTLFDGSGGEFDGRLDVRGRAVFAVDGQWREIDRESPLFIVLAQALANGDKMDWIAQKAVELGAAGLIPLRAERSVLRLSGERADKRREHWRQVMIAACEQCGRNRLPLVGPVTDLADYLEQEEYTQAQRLILSPGGERLSMIDLSPERPIHLLIGPEGGWSAHELALARACQPVTLGPRTLRTETAGLAALAVLQAMWGDG